MSTVITDRRSFVSGLLALVAAPAIVRPESIMRVNPLLVPAARRLIPVGAFEVVSIMRMIGSPNSITKTMIIGRNGHGVEAEVTVAGFKPIDLKDTFSVSLHENEEGVAKAFVADFDLDRSNTMDITLKKPIDWRRMQNENMIFPKERKE